MKQDIERKNLRIARAFNCDLRIGAVGVPKVLIYLQFGHVEDFSARVTVGSNIFGSNFSNFCLWGGGGGRGE